MIPYLRNTDLHNKKVMVRADFNVPIEKGKVTDDERIVRTLPTIKRLLKNNAVILTSHLGRPQGREEKYSLRPVAQHLTKLLDKKVEFARDCIGKEAEEKAASLKNGEVLLLENVRFHPEEEKNDRDFAQNLAKLGDVYVNDAFGASHRAHASVAAITQFLPSYAGLLLEQEITTLESALKNPKRPFVVVLGGGKVSDKLGVIENVLPIADYLLIGGAMMFTLLKATGKNVGASLVEEDQLETMEKLARNPKVVISRDVLAAESAEAHSGTVVASDQIPDGMKGLDVGPAGIKEFETILNSARTIIWNGPMGLFENKTFAKGTVQLARIIARNKGTTIIGGGDTIAAISTAGVKEKLTHVSTGGGAMLEYMEGKKLPALTALDRH